LIKRKVLIIGVSDYLLPIIKILKKKKIVYLQVGRTLSNCKKIFKFDYSKKNKILIFAKKIKATHIIPDGNDTAYLTASYVANKLGMPGYEPFKISDLLLNKKLFYNFCYNNNLPIPKFFLIKKNLLLNSRVKFPILLKPENSYSGIGIVRINNKSDIKKINSKNKILFTEFKKGRLYSHSCFIKKNEIVRSYFVKEFCINYPYAVDFSKTEKGEPNNLQKKLIIKIKKIIKLLNIKSGLIHTQFIVNKNQFYLIEITRRIPGDFYGDLIRCSYSNNDYYVNYVNNFISENYHFSKKIKFTKSIRKNFFETEKKKFSEVLKKYKILKKKKIYLYNNNLLKFDLNNKKKYILVAKYR
jgi:hypothetical protein